MVLWTMATFCRYAYNEQSGTYDEVKADNEIGTVSEIGTA